MHSSDAPSTFPVRSSSSVQRALASFEQQAPMMIGQVVPAQSLGYGSGEPPAVVGGDDAADARWFALDELPDLAFDHDRILGLITAFLGLD